jgi:hypothetical protein
MINVMNKNCKFKDCFKEASYNYENKKNKIYCNEHKLKDMIDIKNKKCLFNGCNIRPVFNYKNFKSGIYCNTHKLDKMINVKDKICIFKDCTTIPIYNFKNELQAIYCAIHKLDEMINIKNKKCIIENCNTIPNYNFVNVKGARYCTTHKLDGMINVKNKKCKTPLCGKLIKLKYEGYCFRCFIYTFPDNPVSRNYKTKEQSVVDYVKIVFPNLTWITDKIIQDGCSNKRPDLLLDLGYQVIIIEIDENQHDNYSCENKRLMQLSQDLNHRSIIFIRFNPDDYIDENNKKIKSCWSTMKTGIIKIENTEEYNNRLMELKNQINYWINNQTNKTIELVKLFYDKN